MAKDGSRFQIPMDTSVFLCSHVFDEEQPVLYVSHDGDGDWQFVCGDSHDDSEPKLVCIEHVLERDSTLHEVANLKCNHTAERETVGADWQIVDEGEAKLLADIAEHGWHVIVVRGDDSGPSFAYSVGMTETLQHPEIIMFGLPGDLMCALINDLGAMIRKSGRLSIGEPVNEIIRDESCVLHTVADGSRKELLRYACWHYGEDKFRSVQCFWPSKEGTLPWESGAADAFRELQPDLRNHSTNG